MDKKKVNEVLKPNIIFLLVDSFRADKCYGNNKTSETPHIDSLIKNGIYFTQAISLVDGTILSLNSTFTALFPSESKISIKKLYSGETSYIHTLKESGYHVYGIMPEVTSLSPLSNFCENEGATYNKGPPAKHLRDGLGQKILDMLEPKKMKEPWFFFIHLMDLHWPLIVNEKYDSEKYGESKYERIVSEIDTWIGKILEKIEMKNTLLVFTADHGHHIPISDKGVTDFEPNLTLGLEIGKRLMPQFSHSFGAKAFILLRSIIREIRLGKANRNLSPYEKRSRLPYFTRSLYDESIRVPLIFAGYGITPRIISQQVSSVDIFPTIAEIVALPRRNISVHGRSLVPLFQGKHIEELPVYIRSTPYETISSEDVVGIRTSKYKYFRASHDKNKKVNLYDLKNDPLENNNIADIHPDVVKEMEKIMTEITKYDLLEHEQEEMSEEEKEKIEKELRKLGYM